MLAAPSSTLLDAPELEQAFASHLTHQNALFVLSRPARQGHALAVAVNPLAAFGEALELEFGLKGPGFEAVPTRVPVRNA